MARRNEHSIGQQGESLSNRWNGDEELYGDLTMINLSRVRDEGWFCEYVNMLAFNNAELEWTANVS